MRNAIVSLLAISCLSANTHEFSLGTEAQCARNHNRYYPRVFVQDTYLYGLNASYEYLEPDNFYAGLFGTYLQGTSKVTETRHYAFKTWYLDRNFDVVQRNLEGRIGYNFMVMSDFFLIPYIGVAERVTRAKSKEYVKPMRMGYETLYLTTGIKSGFVLSRTVEMGISFHRHYAMKGESHSNTKEFYLTPIIYGHEISFPWKINIRDFSIKMEPYFRKDDNRAKELIIGGTLEGSYSY